MSRRGNCKTRNPRIDFHLWSHSSLVAEHSLCKRKVAGSSPACGLFYALCFVGLDFPVWQRVRVVKEVDSKSTGLCPREFKSRRCRLFCFRTEKNLTPEGIEPPIFGSGIRRVTIAPWSHSCSLKQFESGHFCVFFVLLPQNLKNESESAQTSGDLFFTLFRVLSDGFAMMD